MFKYSMVPDGDKIVERDMKKIVDEISPLCDALVLFGAFGRGEGLVLDGVPRNDYDILMIGGNQGAKEKLEKLTLSVEPEVHMVSKADWNDAVPTQQWFEIKYASHHLSGGIKPLPEWEPYEIPYADAVNSLERRSVSMLVAKYEMGKEKPDMRKITEQVVKMVLAIGDATLIKRGQFHPKYTYRNLLLVNDEISPEYHLAVSTKLTGVPELNKDQLWNWWHNTRKRLREYVVDNQIKLTVGEALFAVTDRTTQDQLKDILTKLGAEKWLGGDKS